VECGDDLNAADRATALQCRSNSVPNARECAAFRFRSTLCNDAQHRAGKVGRPAGRCRGLVSVSVIPVTRQGSRVSSSAPSSYGGPGGRIGETISGF
jgi:hypothetical protein